METWLYYVIILLITGAVVGLFSGLLGVGGGFLMVPVQFFWLQSLNIGPDLAMRISLGTSLAVIVPTALSGVYSHYSNQGILLRPAIYMGLLGLLGGLLGGYLATLTPANILGLIFSGLMILAAYQFLRDNQIKEFKIKKLNPYTLLSSGFLVGVVSGLLGIGGGVIIVPTMLFFLGFTIQQAIGTSSIVILLTSMGGLISYGLLGLNIQGLPPYSVGYINLFQFFLLTFTSIPMAYLGSKLTYKISERYLRYSFAVILSLIALKLSGLI